MVAAVDHDALIVVSFGGPEGPDEVMPFLRRVVAGRGVPDERLAQVARQYEAFGGRSPINDQNRRLVATVRELLDLPVYWGNRNAAPFLTDVVREMGRDGITRALAFVTSAYGSYSGCRQYREDIAAAIATVRAEGLPAPDVDKLRTFYNHPLFVDAFVRSARTAWEEVPGDLRSEATLVFTAHSIPVAAADRAPYVAQVRAAAALVAEGLAGQGVPTLEWTLGWQSRSGPPQVLWLEPAIDDVLAGIADAGRRAAIVVPIGFVSDHMEVAYDLDTVAVPAARDRGLTVVRAVTPGVALAPVVAALVAERRCGEPRAFLGSRGPSHDGCPRGCCLAG